MQNTVSFTQINVCVIIRPSTYSLGKISQPQFKMPSFEIQAQTLGNEKYNLLINSTN